MMGLLSRMVGPWSFFFRQQTSPSNTRDIHQIDNCHRQCPDFQETRELLAPVNRVREHRHTVHMG